MALMGEIAGEKKFQADVTANGKTLEKAALKLFNRIPWGLSNTLITSYREIYRTTGLKSVPQTAGKPNHIIQTIEAITAMEIRNSQAGMAHQPSF